MGCDRFYNYRITFSVMNDPLDNFSRWLGDTGLIHVATDSQMRLMRKAWEGRQKFDMDLCDKFGFIYKDHFKEDNKCITKHMIEYDGEIGIAKQAEEK